MVYIWRDFWIRETRRGQQVTKLHDRYMMMMMTMMMTMMMMMMMMMKLSCTACLSIAFVVSLAVQPYIKKHTRLLSTQFCELFKCELFLLSFSLISKNITERTLRPFCFIRWDKDRMQHLRGLEQKNSQSKILTESFTPSLPNRTVPHLILATLCNLWTKLSLIRMDSDQMSWLSGLASSSAFNLILYGAYQFCQVHDRPLPRVTLCNKF
jgi:hypothetical protein